MLCQASQRALPSRCPCSYLAAFPVPKKIFLRLCLSRDCLPLLEYLPMVHHPKGLRTVAIASKTQSRLCIFLIRESWLLTIVYTGALHFVLIR